MQHAAEPIGRRPRTRRLWTDDRERAMDVDLKAQDNRTQVHREDRMVAVTERALPKLREMRSKEGKELDAFRVVFKGFG